MCVICDWLLNYQYKYDEKSFINNVNVHEKWISIKTLNYLKNNMFSFRLLAKS